MTYFIFAVYTQDSMKFHTEGGDKRVWILNFYIRWLMGYKLTVLLFRYSL